MEFLLKKACAPMNFQCEIDKFSSPAKTGEEHEIHWSGWNSKKNNSEAYQQAIVQ